MLASAQNADNQYHGQGYVFIGVGSGTDNPAFGHLGAGGEALLFKGLGVGGEIGCMCVPGEGVGVFSIDPSYHFRHAFPKSKIDPFVQGGYTATFGGDSPVGPAKLFNFGGGINYWFVNRIGLRFELRDYVHFVPFPAGGGCKRSILGAPYRLDVQVGPGAGHRLFQIALDPAGGNLRLRRLLL